jgi:peptidoglycan hydrolase-like protein with peptidoglycan-binding domain
MAAPARNSSSQTEMAVRFPTQAPAKAPAIELSDPSDQVLQIQLALRRFGYDPGRADNLVGRKTRAAILAYQRQNGLEATGDPSGALLRHLSSRQASAQQHAHNETGPGTSSTAGSPGAKEAAGRVAQIQLALQRFGYDPGRVDNVVGRKTRSAILAYQRRNGLEPTGEPSLELLDHLRGTGNEQNTP